MIDGGAEVRSREADERGWDARLDERVRGDGWPSTYPYERRILPKPYSGFEAGGFSWWMED
jgi:hypothetical protein